jgi:hypothetical protein
MTNFLTPRSSFSCNYPLSRLYELLSSRRRSDDTSILDRIDIIPSLRYPRRRPSTCIIARHASMYDMLPIGGEVGRQG